MLLPVLGIGSVILAAVSDPHKTSTRTLLHGPYVALAHKLRGIDYTKLEHKHLKLAQDTAESVDLDELHRNMMRLYTFVRAVNLTERPLADPDARFDIQDHIHPLYTRLPEPGEEDNQRRPPIFDPNFRPKKFFIDVPDPITGDTMSWIVWSWDEGTVLLEGLIHRARYKIAPAHHKFQIRPRSLIKMAGIS